MGDADRFAEAVDDLLPCAVTAPGDVVAVNGVPVRVADGQSPPLASRGRHVHDRVYDVAFGVYWRPASGHFLDGASIPPHTDSFGSQLAS